MGPVHISPQQVWCELLERLVHFLVRIQPKIWAEIGTWNIEPVRTGPFCAMDPAMVWTPLLNGICQEGMLGMSLHIEPLT